MAKRTYQFEIKKDGIIVMRTNDGAKAGKKMLALQAENAVSCSVKDNQDKTLTVYLKDDHQQNYRVTKMPVKDKETAQ